MEPPPEKLQVIYCIFFWLVSPDRTSFISALEAVSVLNTQTLADSMNEQHLPSF